jgi:hypothetical protein
MKRGRAFLIGVGAGAALAWLLDGRGASTRRERARAAVDRLTRGAQGLLGGGMDDAELVAPATPMSGAAGAEAVRDAATASPGASDEAVVRPTPVTAGPLPLTDESAGGHQVLGGGPAAPQAGGADGSSSPPAFDRERP